MRLCTFRPADGPPEGWPGRVDGERIVQLDAPDLITVLARRGQVADAATWPAADVQLLAPVPRPPSVRDFFAFEQHIATARANRGATVPAEWYEFPVFYFTNPAAITRAGHRGPVPGGHGRAGLRARGGRGDRRGRADRRLHGDERLVGA